nr:hypothetical protein CFP56_78380 [Quercus suber]
MTFVSSALSTNVIEGYENKAYLMYGLSRGLAADTEHVTVILDCPDGSCDDNNPSMASSIVPFLSNELGFICRSDWSTIQMMQSCA